MAGLSFALPAHWREGVTYEPLAAALAPAWRVIALDQRGQAAPTMRGPTRETIIGEILQRSALLEPSKKPR